MKNINSVKTSVVKKFIHMVVAFLQFWSLIIHSKRLSIVQLFIDTQVTYNAIYRYFRLGWGCNE